MTGDELVGGLWCSQVLAALSDYLDGELGDETRGQVEAHVAACGNCARFGATVGGVIAAVRAQRGDGEPDPDTLARLRGRLS